MEPVRGSDLRREVREIRNRYPRLQADQAFLVWFLQAYGGADEAVATNALPARGGEKGTDAVLIDDDLRIVFVIQGKYRQSIMKRPESRNDVLDLVRVGRVVGGPGKDFSDFSQGLDPAAEQRLRTGRDRLLRRGYRLQLCYVSTGRCSKPLENEARREARKIKLKEEETATFVLFDGDRVLGLLQEYLDGAAPPVPSVDIHFDGEPIKREDRATGLQLRLFWARGSEIANLYQRSGLRIFHRNVRGFLGLGDSAINREMSATITDNPRSFVYLNNGVTIVCDEARLEEELLHLTNPQIINGQQTTRVLDLAERGAGRVAVQVRVISVPPSLKRDGSAYEELIGDIVRATNRQNAIKPSDLKSNDRIQVLLEREFRKIQYEYVRKRQAKGEARARAPQHRWVISKVDLAKAVAATLQEGLPRRTGREKLFESPLYDRIFRWDDPRQYLTRYWLMKAVDSAARGSGERQWAKFVVLFFLWQELGTDIARRRDTFIRAREDSRTPDRVEDQLRKATESVFKATARFFKTTRGSGPERLEVSPFFKRRDVYEGFEEFWDSNDNPHRGSFEKAADAFVSALKNGGRR